jgi:hypothetical protein
MARAIREDRAPISPVERQLPMMAVLEATHRSETQGQAVMVEYSL